ncbi:hypothetical protein SNE35_06815 [Paucibacter sp. R3-3]|uniref:Uncharacterized protein n=1 Tax=Roseateles agri TaxID=3098619 RepID=A0ABU5DG13_9BURK|nr:hypothetical protein [Paucibacter sp. R3-3]MDY0744209.1 hypothetical protein [Paucibacter sp. R3-3]
MPTFSDVDFKTRLAKGLTDKLSTKDMLKKIDTILDDCLKLAQTNLKTLDSAMADYKRMAKDVYGDVERNLELIKKGDEHSEALLLEMQRSQKDLTRIESQSNSDGTAYSNAFNDDGFRANLQEVIVDRLKTLTKVTEYHECTKTTELGKEILKLAKPVTDAREKIINQIALINGERDRIAEYVKRVTSYIDTASKLVQGEKAEKGKFVTQATSIQGRIGKPGADVQGSLWRDYESLETRITRARGYLTLDNVEAVQKIKDSFFNEGEASRKEFSGILKTVVIDMQALRTLHGKRFYAKLALPKLEKSLNDIANEFKMQQARMVETGRLLEQHLKELGN